MNIEELRSYCISKIGVTEGIPFSKLPDLLVFKVGTKMFVATDLSNYDGITIKANPLEIPDLIEHYEEVNKPSYMSHKHWIYVKTDGSLDPGLIKEWIDTSYDLVVKKMTKKERNDLGL